jgi:peptidoglycan hydrolase CwlO-like protein
MNENIMTVLISAVVSIFTGLIGFATGRKKSLAEADTTTLGNVEKALEIYKQMLDDMKERYDKEISSLKTRLKNYEEHIKSLQGQLKDVKKQ